MTTFTFTPTEDDVFTVLRAFLQDILPPSATSPSLVGHVVIVGQENRVPEPADPNFVLMTMLRAGRLATNLERLAGAGDQRGLEQSITQNTQVVIQLDVHGPEASNNAGRISTLFRSSYATEFFAGRTSTIAPLFADDPRQVPFVSGEKQYEDRWVIEANLQVNLTATAVAQSARTLTVGMIDIETDPDGWPNSIATATNA